MLPSAHGRGCSGTTDTATSQASAVTRNAVAPIASPRRRTPCGAHATQKAATAAAPSSDSASLTSKANPTNNPASAIPRARRLRTATTTPATHSAAMTESIVSLRAVTTALGRTASARPPARLAARPQSVRSSTITNATSATPPSASGRCSASGPKPRALVLATCSHRSTGGLSIATRRPGSKAPARNALHDVPIERTAAS
ncbi:MAG TPA: hypothetical protein VI318_09395 [Baekduia sp.]